MNYSKLIITPLTGCICLFNADTSYMNLEDTTEINRSSMVKQHILDWKSWKLKHSIHDCEEERLLAGWYLEWARGDLEYAIKAVATHCSGEFIDRPPFFLCNETLAYLQDLQKVVAFQAS